MTSYTKLAMFLLVFVAFSVALAKMPSAQLAVGDPTPATQSVIAGNSVPVTSGAVSGGSGNYSPQWLEEAPGASAFTNAVDCASSATISTCTFATTASTPLGIYSLKMFASDTTNSADNGISNPATINVITAPVVQTPLAANDPVPISQSVTVGDQANAITSSASGGTSPYTYQWFESTPSNAAFSAATDCLTPTPTSCTFVTNSMTTPGTYNFELQVTDSSAPTNSVNSIVASIDVVSAQSTQTPLTINAPTPATQPIIVGNTATITAPSATGGSGNYVYQWLENVPNNAIFGNALADCVTPNTLVCTFSTNTLTTRGTYNFELMVIDGNFPTNTFTSTPPVSVTVENAPTALAPLSVNTPTPSAQTVTVNNIGFISDTVASGGSGSYIYQWLEEPVGSSLFANAVDCSVGSSSTNVPCTFATNALTTTGTYQFKLDVADAANTANVVNSIAVSILVENAPTTTTNTTTIPNGGGGVVSSGGGGGTPGTEGGTGGISGVLRPTIANVTNGFIVSNLTRLGVFSNVFCGTLLQVTDNFVSPNQTGITVNGASYLLPFGGVVKINGTPQPCYVELFNDSYLPIIQTIELSFFTNATRPALPSTSAITTSATTTINPNAAPSTSPGLLLVNYSYNATPASPAIVYIAKANTLIYIDTPTPTVADLIVYGISGTAHPFTGYTPINILNITISAPVNVSGSVVMGYPCSVPSSKVAPYTLTGSTWTPITNFSVDAPSCLIKFHIPNDPTVGVFYSGPKTPILAPSNSSTSIPTITSGLLSQKVTTYPFGLSLVEIIFIVMIVIVVVIVAYFFREA